MLRTFNLISLPIKDGVILNNAMIISATRNKLKANIIHSTHHGVGVSGGTNEIDKEEL